MGAFGTYGISEGQNYTLVTVGEYRIGCNIYFKLSQHVINLHVLCK